MSITLAALPTVLYLNITLTSTLNVDNVNNQKDFPHYVPHHHKCFFTLSLFECSTWVFI